MTDKIIEEIKVGDFITVGESWLRACGFANQIGKPFEVKSIRSFGHRGTLYMIDMPGYREWEVFNWNGVVKVDSPNKSCQHENIARVDGFKGEADECQDCGQRWKLPLD